MYAPDLAFVHGLGPGAANMAHIRQSRPENMAHIRQSRPDSGLGFQVEVLKIFQVVPSSLESSACVSALPRSIRQRPLEPEDWIAEQNLCHHCFGV